MRKIILALVTVFMYFLLYSQASQASQDTTREDIIARRLDCLSKHYQPGKDIQWADVCYTGLPQNQTDAQETQGNEASASTRSAQATMDQKGNVIVGSDSINTQDAEDQEPPGEEQGPDEVVKAPKPQGRTSFWKMDPLFERENPLTQMEFGFEAFSYEYREDDLMNLEGWMYGMHGSFAKRMSLNEHIRSLGDVLSDTNKINMFKLDARLSFGQLDYASYGTGQDSGIPNWATEIRGVLGYDIPVMTKSMITPYLGLGYRYLFDDGGGRRTTTGHIGYDRESFYFYIPMGLESEFALSDRWFLGMTLEYDLWLDGQQISHLEDVGNYDQLENDQNHGYGARASVRLMKTGENLDLFFEPFVRYWRIKDSEISVVTSGGVPVGSGPYVLAGTEPENDTTEIGLKLGMRF